MEIISELIRIIASALAIIPVLIMGLFMAIATMCSDSNRILEEELWNGNKILLEEQNGGATVSFSHSVTINEEVIFSSYGSPLIDSLTIRSDSLILHDSKVEKEGESIKISLRDYHLLIKKPIVYYRYILRDSIEIYNEPQCIKRWALNHDKKYHDWVNENAFNRK